MCCLRHRTTERHITDPLSPPPSVHELQTVQSRCRAGEPCCGRPEPPPHGVAAKDALPVRPKCRRARVPPPALDMARVCYRQVSGFNCKYVVCGEETVQGRVLLCFIPTRSKSKVVSLPVNLSSEFYSERKNHSPW